MPYTFVDQDIPRFRVVESSVMDIGRSFMATGLFVRKLIVLGFTLCSYHLEAMTLFSASTRLLLNYIGDVLECLKGLLDFLYHIYTLRCHVTVYCHTYVASG